MNHNIFLFLNFSVAFVSDIVLNDLSTHFNIFKTLQPYFYNQSILKCAFYAGLTVAIALLITMIFSYYLFGFILPTTITHLFYFCILAFVLGYIIDIVIYKMKVFNGLDTYYKTYGAGLWGGLAFVFSILISYFIQKHISIKL
jgi:hypothetical protein